MSTFTCTQCGIKKALNQFPPNNSRERGHQSYCRDCARETQRRYRRANPSARQRERARQRAYNHALLDLRDAHPDEYQQFYLSRLREYGRADTADWIEAGGAA